MDMFRNLSIIFIFLFSFCQTWNQTQIYNSNPYFYLDTYTTKIPIIPISFSEIWENRNQITKEQWNFFAIQFYLKGELSFSEYCFLQALKQTQPEPFPYPYQSNFTIRTFLNLLIFYEITKNIEKEYAKKLDKKLKEYLHLIQYREDFMVYTLQEIRKRNLPDLEIKIAQELYNINQKHGDFFLYEYLWTLIHLRKISPSHINIIFSIKRESLRNYMLMQLANYFYRSQQYQEYIQLYEYLHNTLPTLIQQETRDHNSPFYIENIFYSYYKLYKNQNRKQIPISIYQNIIKQKQLSLSIYRSVLDYFSREYFFYSNLKTIKKFHIKNTCKPSNILLDRICIYQNQLLEIQIRKEVFQTSDWTSIQKAKKMIFNLY